MYSFQLNKTASSNDKSKISVDESFEKSPKAILSRKLNKVQSTERNGMILK